MTAFARGKHVMYVPGAGEEAVIAHYGGANDDGTDKIQVPGGGIENVPRQEPENGEYVADPDAEGYENLGRTWHTITEHD